MRQNNIVCHLCGDENSRNVFESTVLGKYKANYFLCTKCGMLFVNQPSWLDEAYRNSINIYDTGILARNIAFSRMTAGIIYLFFRKNSKFLDYAGGYGVFTRLMRDIGFDFYWHDTYSTNLMARGFEMVDEMSDFELVTCFEVFEHLADPTNELESIFSLSKNIIFSTELLSDPIPAPDNWWYYGLEHGQHVSFYSEKTFKYLANKYNVNFYTFGSFHMFTPKQLSPVLLKLLMKTIKFGFLHYVHLRMKSKTINDMEYIKSIQ